MGSHVIGIDVGGTMIKGGLFDEHGTLIKKESIPTGKGDDQEHFIDAISSLAGLLQKDGPASGLGMGAAGVIDRERTLLIESPNLPCLNNFPVKQMLERTLSMPVFIENDANVAALGERWAGSGKDESSFLLITLGTGIGSGLILNGSLWSGEKGKAGEFGHLVVNPDGALCACGKKGCLEAHASGTAIVRMAREELAAGGQTSLQPSHDTPDGVTPEAVYREAKKGDRICADIYYTAARYLAVGIANVNNLLDIHHFILGGGVSKAFDLFADVLIKEIRCNVFSVSRDAVRVVVSRLGNDAGIYGAGYLAKEQYAGR